MKVDLTHSDNVLSTENIPIMLSEVYVVSLKFM